MLHNLIRLARHDVRVHVRRRVVHIPVRQTALRPVATVATEQGKDAHRFPCHVKVIFLSCRRFYHIFFCLCRMCLPFPSSWKILVIPDTSEGKPSEPPFLLRGSISPVPPRCLRSSNRAVYKKRLATMLVYTSVAGSFTYQHDKPHLDPSPRRPPNRATATIVLLNHNPSHSYVVSLPDATVGILPMSDAISILEQ